MIQCGGTIIFKGNATIGNDSAISVGKHGVLTIGNDFTATASLKLVCFHKVNIDNDVLIGWNCMICDTDFHRLSYVVATQSKSSGYGPIIIGNHVWIANGCKLYKNTTIQPFNIVGSDTIITKAVESPEYSLICNQRSNVVKATGVYLNRENEAIDYNSK